VAFFSGSLQGPLTHCDFAAYGTGFNQPTDLGGTIAMGVNPYILTPTSTSQASVSLGSMADLSGTRVLVFAADLFEDMELLYPVARLQEEGAAVTVAGLDDQPVHGKKGYGPLAVDTTVDQVKESDFDGLVIPGGFAPDKLRRSETVLDLVRAFDTAGKPIAFICHAGWVPISAKIVKGRRATSVGAIRDDMVNAGVDWVDGAAVVDGNLISARTPADLGPWMKALIAALADGP
jgi:protease I